MLCQNCELKIARYDFKTNQRHFVSGEMEKGAYTITNKIKINTTIEEFDQLVASTAGYKLENGGRCGFNALCVAAMEGNFLLVKHFTTLGDHHLLNLAESNGFTPLHHAVLKSYDTKQGKISLAAMACIKILISGGADVNLATCNGQSQDILFQHATPLCSAAAQGIENLPTIKLLLLHGAILYGKRNSLCNVEEDEPESIDILNTVTHAKKELFSKPKEIFIAYQDEYSAFNLLPKEIIDIIIKTGIVVAQKDAVHFT